MNRISTAIVVSDSGKVEVLYAGLDASKALDAYKACQKPGKCGVIVNGHPDRTKRNHAAPVVADIEPKRSAKSK